MQDTQELNSMFLNVVNSSFLVIFPKLFWEEWLGFSNLDCHKPRYADLVVQLNVEGLSAVRHIIRSISKQCSDKHDPRQAYCGPGGVVPSDQRSHVAARHGNECIREKNTRQICEIINIIIIGAWTLLILFNISG